MSSHGFLDFVAVKSNGNHPPEILLVDVKSYHAESRSYAGLTDVQRYAGVRILKVHADGHCELVDSNKERVRKDYSK